MAVDLNDFKLEISIIYKDEKYSVRDNGAVLRHNRKGKRLRKYDNQWTFGNPNKKTGYMEIASVRIHRIIATAFHGEPPTKNHVVDHIDTNKRNNRPENLRWVTRLENVLLNPITVKRIELACGCSIEEFLSDPSKFKDKFQEPNNKWMCMVSKEEAQASKRRLLAWAKIDKLPSGGSLGEWIYNRNTQKQYVEKVNELTKSLTPNAKQKNWKTPSKFPCCPQERAEEPISAYFKMLKVGLVFCQNEVYSSLVSNSAISDNGQSIYVITESTEGENAVKPWALSKITYENGFYVHKSIQTFFSKEGAEKQYFLAQGLEWTGGESIDDYC